MSLLYPFLSLMKREKRRLSIITSAFIFIFFIFFCVYKLRRPTNTEENIAIIFVPGIGVSGLFNTSHDSLKYDQNTNIWLYGDEYPMGNIWSSEESKKNILENNYYDFYCNQFGNPINPDIKPLNAVQEGMKPRDIEMVLYGYSKMFEQPIKKLKYYLSLYSEKKINVFMFNYDWRLSVAKNATLLKKEIEKYSDVIVVAFSLGGLVSIHAFQELENDGALSKIKGFIACAVPFLGSYNACSALMDGSGIVDFVFVPSGIKKKLRDVCRNFNSIYDLLPYSFFSTDFINKERNFRRFVQFDFNPRLYAESFSSYIKRSMFRWYNKVPNIYIINSDKSNKDLDVDDSMMFTNNYFSKYVPGDGTVPVKSSYPFFLKDHIKDLYTVKDTHMYVMLDPLVQDKIMEYTGKILNIQKDSSDKETFEYMLKKNGFSSLF